VTTLRAVAAAGVLIASGALAQDFPSKSVRLIVPFPPGGAVDIIGRTMGPPLGKGLGQSVIVENRPGANTVIGAELVVRAPADGHTVLLMAQSYTVNAILRTKLPYDTFKDFSGVTRLASNPLVVSVHPSVPARTVKELVALARSRPGELTFGTASILGGQRLAMELFKEAAKFDAIAIPYNGGAPAATAVMGGHTTILVANIAETAPFVEAGRLRAIAVTSLERNNLLPKVPTIAESGYPGFQALQWFGVAAPAGTPRAVIEKLSAAILRALERPEVRARFAGLGIEPMPMGPDRFAEHLRSETRTFAEVIRAAAIHVE